MWWFFFAIWALCAVVFVVATAVVIIDSSKVNITFPVSLVSLAVAVVCMMGMYVVGALS
jgi:hypothetical protein